MFERVSGSGIFAGATDGADGTVWVPLGDHPCSQVIIHNKSGTDLEVGYREGATAALATGQTSLTIADDTAMPLRGVTNSNQLVVKRTDDSDTGVDFVYVVEG